jgi:cytochrome c
MPVNTRFAALVTGLILACGLAQGACADCDVEAGKRVFNKCGACHSLDEGAQMMGPSLHGLMGRTAGKVEGFAYSVAMEEADFTWNAETLSAFLEQPMQYLPGTSMPFAGLKRAEQRQAIVCLFENNSSNP